MIKNIVFDIGNVLTDFRWQGFLKDKGFDDEMVARIGKATVEGPYWKEFDRGGMSHDEILGLMAKEAPEIADNIIKAFSDTHGMVTGRDYAIPWIKSLKEEGYRVYYLSNFSEKAARECSEALGFISFCDGGILSCTVKIIKPDHRIYELLCERFDLEPAECVFLDDTEANVTAAKECGFEAIVFTDKESACAGLRSLGVRA